MDSREDGAGSPPATRLLDASLRCSKLEDTGLYEPAEDTFFLASYVEHMPSMRVAADVGCGSGLTTLSLSSRCEYSLAIDVNYEAASAARQLLAERASADVIVADRLLPIRDRSLDGIISNPPYLPCDYCSEPLWCGGERGVEFAASLAEQASFKLKRGGTLIVLLSSLSDVQSFLDRARDLGYEVTIAGEKHLGLFERLYIVRCTLNPST